MRSESKGWPAARLAVRNLFLVVFLALVLTASAVATCNPQNDSDCDGFKNAHDNCPSIYNPNQADADGDEAGDVCDNCPQAFNADQADSDLDGRGNVCDNCPQAANPNQADGDQDGHGNVCDNCPANGNPTQSDVDQDDRGDICDNCPLALNANQADGDVDGRGDACDNCPSVANYSQDDADLDGAGDVCDAWTICAPMESVLDRKVLPDPDYSTFVPPPKGMTYTDAALHCPVTRLSDGAADFGHPVRHDPVFVSPFNSNSTRIAVYKGAVGVMVIDRSGNVIRDTTELVGVVAPRWSVNNPNVFYFIEGSKLRSYDVATATRQDVHDFSIAQPPEQTSGYSSIELGPKSNSDISEDGDHLLISNQSSVHVYTISTDHVGPKLSGAGFADTSATVANCDLTPSADRVACHFDLSGQTFPERWELFDAASGNPSPPTGSNVVITAGGHPDIGRDLNGDAILVRDNSGDPSSLQLPGCYPGVEKIKLVPGGARTCLISWAHADPSGNAWFGKSIHVSINNVGGHPWALISTNDEDAAGTRAFDLQGNWQDLWGAYFNELILVKLDGSQIHRLAHHRSRDGIDFIPACDPTINAGYDYWSTVRASLSRDGEWLVFDSNYALRYSEPDATCVQPTVKNYGELYLVHTVIPPPTPPCGPCQVSYCSAVGIRCTFNNTCGGPGCCNYSCLEDETCTNVSCPPKVCGGCF